MNNVRKVSDYSVAIEQVHSNTEVVKVDVHIHIKLPYLVL